MMKAQEYIPSPPSPFQDFLHQLQKVKNDFFSGSLIVHLCNSNSCFVFNFYLGRLNWSGRNFGKLDSWQRHLGILCDLISAPEISALSAVDQPEVVSTILADLLAEQKINRKQLHNITAAIFEEDLFDAIQFACVTNTPFYYEWVPSKEQVITITETLPLLSIKEHTTIATQKWWLWQGQGLSYFYLNLSIQLADLKQIKKSTLTEQQKKLLPFLTAGDNLRTLSHTLRQPTFKVAETLLPLLTSKIINLVPNVPAEVAIDSSVSDDLLTDCNLEIDLAYLRDFSPEATLPKSPLIFCIDDSEIVFQRLLHILTPYDCQVMGIQDSTRAIPALIKAKPDLIFLDLIMPITNGYEICTQIRRTPCLDGVPVIILTSRDGLMNKLRAKMVGSHDFISKPIEPEEVLKMLFYYLPVKQYWA